MIKPERMSRIAIVGPRKELDRVIRHLYELNLFHLVDFVEEEEEVKIGNPLPQASDISQRLIRLRSIIRALKLDEVKPDKTVPSKEIERTSDQAIVTLELEVTRKVENRQNISSRMHEIELQNSTLDMFSDLGLPLDAYSEYDNLSVFSGTVQVSVERRIRKIRIPLDMVEVQHGTGYAIAIFCRKKDSGQVLEILGGAGYQEIKPPFSSGTAREHILADEKEIVKLEKSLVSAEEDIEALKEKYAPLVLAAEEHYSIEIQKAEAPLRIATTPNSFVIDGWIPKSSYIAVETEIDKKLGKKVSVEDLAIAEKKEIEEAPSNLRNSILSKPYELFTKLMSTPNYNEVDPTIFLFLVFPLFFGIMIGDFGYGIGLIVAGFLMFRKWGQGNEDFGKLCLIIISGGVFACIFGLLFFGEMFGLPFHPPEHDHDVYNWEFLFNFPLHPVMEKLHAVSDYLVLSVVAAWIHISAGFILGFFNELHHDRRHAVVKILWLIILLGLFMQLMFIAQGNSIGGFFYGFIGAPFAELSAEFAGMTLSFVAIGLIVAGAAGFFVILGAGGAMEFMEILSLLSNVISYTRIAGIGIAKGAMAYAFNWIVIENFFLGGNIIIIILGAVVLVVLHLLVFILGSMSAGIQALRLNYVEFFLKFFKGGGVEFEPLGYKRKYSSSTEV